MAKIRSKIEIEILREKARKLIEGTRDEQKIIAMKLAISQKTLSTWVVKYKWKRYNEMEIKLKHAKQIVLVQGFQQKEAAQIVGVSEKTIGAWAKKNNWKAKRRHYEKLEPDLKAFVAGFKWYLKNHSKHDYDNVSSLLDEYYNNHFLKDKKTIF